MDMRDNHLTLEEIVKYMDAADLSEDYMLWLEKAAGHILACSVCQEKLGQAMTAEGVCEEEGLAAGLLLMEREEEIRKDILIAHLSRMQEQARIAELIRQLRGGVAERFTFSVKNLQRNVGAARGAALQGEPQRGRQVTLEKADDKLLLRIPARIPGEPKKISRTGAEGMDSQELPRSLTVILRIEDGEPIVKEAPWDEACGQYVAIVEGAESGEKLELYITGEQGQ